MNTIEINNTGINVDISVFLFKEDDVFHAYCPELDLAGYDYTEEGAKRSFEFVLKDYLDYTVENGTLEQDLMNHGWRKSKTGKVSEPGLSRPITLQAHVDPVPELIIRNTLSNLGKTKQDFFDWYYKK